MTSPSPNATRESTAEPDSHSGKSGGSSSGPIAAAPFALLLLLTLIARLLLAGLTGDQDTHYFQDWAYGLADSGVAAAYDNPDLDYPPLVIYLFYPIGLVYQTLLPEPNPDLLHTSPLFVALIKLPNLCFDLVLAGLLYWLVAAGGVWRRVRAGPGWGRLAALVYLWNPAVLWGSAYWGQPDSIHSALVVASFAALGFSRWGLAGVLLAAAVMMKPLAAPLLPLFVLVLVARAGLRGALRAGAGGFATATLLLLPFLVSGRGLQVLERLVGDINSMAFTAMNAHNFWTLVAPWHVSTEPILGSLTPQLLSMLLFAGACVPLLARAWRLLSVEPASRDNLRAQLFLLAAAVYCSFFYFSVHMHENHLYLAVPLLLLVAGRSRPLALLALAASLACLFNMAIHDIDLPYQLPGWLGARAPWMDPYLVWDHSFNPIRHAYGDDLHYTWLQVFGMGANLLLTACVIGFTYRQAWRRQGP